MNFKEYIAALQAYLEEHPETADNPVLIGNGYCTSDEYVRVQLPPHTRKLLGKMGKRYPGEVVILL